MVPRAASVVVISWLAACTPNAASEPEVHEVVLSNPEAPPAAPRASRPLQRWMESELLYRIRTRDFRGMVRSLDALAAVAPDGDPDWAEVASRASQAARDNDVEAVRRGCATCHQQYRARYRSAPIDFDIDRLIARSRQ
jgi:hypothetical protein